MMKSVADKVIWVGRTTVFMVGLTVILALVLGIASAALGANGKPLILGSAKNTASKATALIGKVATGSAFTVKNPSGGSALGLQVNADQAPLEVNPEAGTATNLSADELDGKDSAAYQRRVGEGCAEGSSIRTIDAEGRPTCEPDDDRGLDEALALRTELGTDDGFVNGRSDPVSFSKVRNVPQDVVDRNADTLDGRDSEDFAAADHQHLPVVRRAQTTIPRRDYAFGQHGLGLVKMCQQDEIATSWGGGFLDYNPKQAFLHNDEVYGGVVADHSWGNGEIFRRVPMKWGGSQEAGYVPVQAGDGDTPQGWNLIVFNEADAPRDFDVWVVCQS